MTIDTLHSVITAPVRNGLYLLLLSVLALLAVVCVNLAGLLLARATARAREFSIRTAIGAGRSRLFQQVVLETLLLVGAGGAIGLGAAVVALRSLSASGALDLPRGTLVEVDGGVVQFALLLVFACALVIAWLPALHLAGSDAQPLLRASSGRLSGSRRTVRLRGGLVGAQVALSTVLLIGAALLVVSLARVLYVDRGFQAPHAVATRVTIPEVRYASPESRTAFFERTLDALRRLPGVTSAALVSGLPLTGESQVNGIQLEGSDAEAVDPATRAQVLVNVRFVSPEYFQTLGIPLVAGRRLDWSDRSRQVAVISQQLAAKIWPSRDPLGRRFATGSGVGQVEVVGVVGDVHNASLEGPPTPIVYVPFSIGGTLGADLVVATTLDERALAPSIRSAVWSVDPAVPLSAMRTIEDVVSEAVKRRRFQMQMGVGFAAAALLLTVLGIYGIVSYSAAQRRKEIGIRLALGAARRDILVSTIRAGLAPVVLGLGAGVAAALLGSRFVAALLFGVGPRDPLVIGGSVVMLGLVAFLATLLAARGAAQVEPVEVLMGD